MIMFASFRCVFAVYLLSSIHSDVVQLCATCCPARTLFEQDDLKDSGGAFNWTEVYGNRDSDYDKQWKDWENKNDDGGNKDR